VWVRKLTGALNATRTHTLPRCGTDFTISCQSTIRLRLTKSLLKKHKILLVSPLGIFQAL
jgi:hypothetical protein